MGYTALLFCPDEKTARTVTQVLSELEFAVEACIEPFVAVKKLMGQHFDAVVVDCDNEQNATLLFKSARNSTSNQTSLAVAVVEGQAGVAKAFRIGANLVLTKPINIEQAKGTLRVARGLLRKSEPAKPGAPATASAPAPAPPATTPTAPAGSIAARPAAPKTILAAKPAAPAPPKPVSPPVAAAPAAPRPAQTLVAKPAQTAAWPAAAAATPKPGAQDDDLLEIDAHAKPAPTAPAGHPATTKFVAASPKEKQPPAPAAELKSTFPASAQAPIGSGAASAPAPARVAEKATESTAPPLPGNAGEAASSEPSAYVGAAPTFSFGATAETGSPGGNKKIFIGVAAALVAAVVGYFGWTQLKGHSAATPAPASTVAVTTPQPSKPAAVPPTLPVTPAAPTSAGTKPNLQPAETAPATSAASDTGTDSQVAAPPVVSKSPKSSINASSAATKGPAAAKPEAVPMVVKGGKVPATHTDAPAADAPPPSMAGLATGATPPPDLVTSAASGVTPTLQTLSISQGVSQGLLYKKVSPVYPPNALRMRIEGAVELQATISKTGDISHVKIIRGDAQLTRAAADAVKQWKYKPYLLNGEPVEIQTQVTINFKLPH